MARTQDSGPSSIDGDVVAIIFTGSEKPGIIEMS
jgi:hypothetical protein